MGGRGTSSKAIAFHVRQNALSWARTQIGSKEYARAARLGKWKEGNWKCNAFVIRAFNHNVIPEVIGQRSNPWTAGITNVPYRAQDFYNGKVPGFVQVKHPQPGDVCADGKHVGIVSQVGKTISATKDSVVENEWGFRENEKGKSRFFRYVGSSKNIPKKKK